MPAWRWVCCTLPDGLAMDPVFAVVLRVFLALVLLVAALHKLREPGRFVAVLDAYHLLPRAIVPAVAHAVPVGEVVVGLLLLAGSAAGATGATALFGVYGLAIGINLARGRRDLDCGCGGHGARQPIAPWMLARNAVLLACAAALLGPERSRALTWLDGATALPATLALFAMYAAVERLGANREAVVRLRGTV